MINITESQIMQNWVTDSSDVPVVSVLCPAYNHELYIAQALDSFLMQETDFPFEVVVHDDASTDGTARIIREYEARFPNIIKPIYETENQFSKSQVNLVQVMIVACRGNYVAYCEGDDYWTDASKLQKQVQYLERHPSTVGCCCRYDNYSEITKQKWSEPDPYFDNTNHCSETSFEFNREYNLLFHWTTKTLTMVWRKDVIVRAIQIAHEKKFDMFYDTHQMFYAMDNGNCACLNFIGGVYRYNINSIWGTKTDSEQAFINYKQFKTLAKRENNPLVRYLYKWNKENYMINYSNIWLGYKFLLRIHRKISSFIYPLIYRTTIDAIYPRL